VNYSSDYAESETFSLLWNENVQSSHNILKCEEEYMQVLTLFMALRHSLKLFEKY
jgi:hypothetical protein